jgi:hypothetical protein
MARKKYKIGTVARASELGYHDYHLMRLVACSICGKVTQWVRLGDERLEDWECIYCQNEAKRKVKKNEHGI